MNTAFALMACYQKPLIPLETVGADYLGLGKREVNEQAVRNKLPFPAIRLTDSAKAPRFVRIEDLAKESTNKPSRHKKAGNGASFDFFYIIITKNAYLN